MKTSNKSMALVVLLLSILASCKKQDIIDYPEAIKFPSLNNSHWTNNIDTVRLMIIGTYEWACTTVSDRSGTRYQYPYTEKTTYRYIFRSDSTVEFYQDQKLKWSNKYIVDYEMPLVLLPSAGTMIWIMDKTTNQQIEYFYPTLSNDSAIFSNPGSVDVNKFFRRH